MVTGPVKTSEPARRAEAESLYTTVLSKAPRPVPVTEEATTTASDLPTSCCIVVPVVGLKGKNIGEMVKSHYIYSSEFSLFSVVGLKGKDVGSVKS